MTGWETEKQRWEPSPDPDAQRRRHAREWGLWATASVLAAAVLATVTFGGALLLFDDDEAQGAQTSAETTPGANGTDGSEGADQTEGSDGTGETDGTDGTDAGPAPEPPPGFGIREDAQGFQVQVREGWERREEQRDAGDVVFYETDGGDGLLQVYRISEPDFTPADALRETDRLKSQDEGYQRIRLEATDTSGGSQSAELEYLLTRTDGTRQRALLTGLVDEEGVRWGVLVSGPDDEWDATYAESAKVAAASFCAQAYCAATP
ncbi:hypothetical protein ACIOHB_25690 [Streptomyces microflavus]|uniref:hypothetical protein n=1 Tax=Streptomyces microflavus TaxID=1919 RepID=UPI002E381EBA|nr:hypothetical protein [Streptomyces microflavus]